MSEKTFTVWEKKGGVKKRNMDNVDEYKNTKTITREY